MSKINRVPKGLQSLFGNTAAGKNPSELELVVRPVIDMFGLWGVEQTDIEVLNGTFAAVFDKEALRVPEGELWIPLSLSGQMSLAAIGENARISIGISDEGATKLVALAHSDRYVATTASEAVGCAYTWSQTHPATAQQFFYVQCDAFDAAAARNVTLALKFIRLQV